MTTISSWEHTVKSNHEIKDEENSYANRSRLNIWEVSTSFIIKPFNKPVTKQTFSTWERLFRNPQLRSHLIRMPESVLLKSVRKH